MKVKSILLGVLIGCLAAFFATPALAAIGNQGRILYTKSVVRATDGTITSTGNLFVKDLATGTEQQVTNYSGSFSILNPMFNANGDKIIFTSNVTVGSDSTYKIYIVSADATVSTGVGIELQSGVSTINYKYAALSPDEKTIAFVYDVGGNSSLWTYNRDTGIYQQVYEDPVNGIEIRNVVFVNATTLAFIGKSGGIQNIYITDLTGPTTTKITNNTVANQEYINLKSGISSSLAGNILIYSKRTKVGLSWYPFDVYVAVSLVPFVEVNVTNTTSSGQDEYDACFYGDDSALRDVQLTATNGNMFYIAKVIGSANKVWQANFDTTGGPTNTGKTQRTVDADVAGQVDWGPPVIEMAPVIGIGNTEIVSTNGTPANVFMIDLDENGQVEAQTQLTTHTDNSKNPSLGAARIVYSLLDTALYKMNPDGTNNVLFVDSTTTFVPVLPSGIPVIYKMPSISPDGKWVVFVAGPSAGTKKICVKRLSEDVSGNAINLNIGTNPEDPIISPDMSSIVWVENNSGQRTIKKINVVFDATADTASVIGSEMTLGGNTTLFNDNNPSFSPDGQTIIFVSDRDGTSRIYTMNASTGLGVTRFPGLAGVTNPAYPVYSPLGDGSIAFVADGPGGRTIQTATAQGIVTDLGVVVNGDRIDWEIERTVGEIVATRTLQSRAAAGTTLEYRIDIDVDDGQVPVAYTLNEVVPSWTVVSVERDGTTLTAGTNYFELPNTPVAGLKTLRFVFSNAGGSAGTVADHILTISLTVAGSGTKSFSGEISYFMFGAQTATVLGNGTLNVLNPYCPVDKYNSKGQENNPDGVIQDLDLLYGIEAWANNAQLPGYGTGWPVDPDTNWDGIILAVINIWASPAGTQGWYTGDNQVTDASTVAGEYQYVGPSEYQSGNGQPTVDEMYWTQGEWID